MKKRMIDKESIGASYEAVKKFNDIAGRFSSGNKVETIDLILSFCFEELSETIEAFEKQDAPNLLKEACDLWVVTASLLQVLEDAGFDVAGAMAVVDENNLSKFPKETQPYTALPIGAAFTEYNDKHKCYILKRADGKVMKPLDYVKADVSQFVPKGFGG